MDQQTSAGQHLTEIAAEIVSAYVANNSVATRDLPDLISSVYGSLVAFGEPAPAPEAAKPVPHMAIKKTITPDYLVSLEDGRHYKSLKRHLNGRGLTPQQYREKWSLPADYPMVASSYAAKRSELAKNMGLGRKQAANDAAPAPKRGRATKAA